MALVQGELLGRYEILGPLGAGGMGEVYRARDTGLEREVAVKVLPEEVAGDTDRLERFRREAKAVAALSHPNILGIFDVGSVNGVEYAVTELLEGDTLRGRIPVSGLPWQKVVEYGSAIANGLAAAHAKDIIHRDLKPENIFITADGRVKLLDFGLAKVRTETAPEAETATLTPAGTQAGTVLGTIGYMAPEQVKGHAADARSDIFALGCVLYEMVSGRQAFGADTGVEMMAAILKEEPLQLSSTGIAVPADLERAIHRCLEKSPEARFQSAADLAYNLRSIGTSSAPVMTSPSGDVRVVKGGVLRWAAGVAVAVVLVATGYIEWQRLSTPEGSTGTAGNTAASTTPAYIDEWLVAVEPFENRTGDSALDTAGVLVADRLVQSLPRLTYGLKLLPRVTVVAVGGDDTEPPRTLNEPAKNVGSLLITGSYTPADEGLEIVGQVRDLDSRRVLFATKGIAVPSLPSSASLEPMVDRLMAAVGIHVQWGLEHESHVPSYEVFRQNLIGWEMSWSGTDSPHGQELIETAFETDPEYLRPAVLRAGNRIWAGKRDEAERYIEHIRQRSYRLTEHESLSLEILEAWKADEPGRALRAARRLQEIDPTNPYSRFFRAEFAQQLNRPGEVVAAYAGILGRVPRSLTWYRRHVVGSLLAAYEQLGEYQSLLDLGRRVRADSPGSTLALGAEAVALAGLGRLEELEAVVEECRSQPGGDCDEVEITFHVSHHLALAGHRSKSVEYARRVLDNMESMPEDELYSRWRMYLVALRLAGEWSRYASFSSEGLERSEPDSFQYFYFRLGVGMAAAHAGDRETAEAAIEELTAKGEYSFAGQVAANLGDLDRGVELIRRDIEEDPEWTYKDLSRWDPDLEPLLGYEPFEELIRPKG